jgi:transcriptional regulator with XRE-family HTH domain
MPKSVGTALKTFRMRAHLSQQGLADAAGVHPAIISRLEGGKRQAARFDILLALVDALGVTLDDLAKEAGIRRAKKTWDRRAAPLPPSVLEPKIASARSHLLRATEALDDILESK